MIQITPSIIIDDDEIQLEFMRASGPGGQKVNKTATAVQLRFDVMNSPTLPGDVRRRLLHLAGKRMTEDGVLVIHAHRFRTQVRNRQDAIQRLIVLLREAANKPKPRYKTKPTYTSIQRRLDKKRRRSKIKRMRRYTLSSDE